VAKPGEKKPLGRRSSREDNIEMDLGKTVWSDGMYSSSSRYDQCRAFVNTVTNLRVP
jgi:hypothetical protein